MSEALSFVLAIGAGGLYPSDICGRITIPTIYCWKADDVISKFLLIRPAQLEFAIRAATLV